MTGADAVVLQTAPQLGVLGHVTPGLPLILAGLIGLFIKPAPVRKVVLGLGVAAGFVLWFFAEHGTYGVLTLPSMGLSVEGALTLETFRYDAVSRVFGLVFLIAAGLNVIYGLHERSPAQDGMALAYAGAAIGAVFAGDFVTLFVFWELTAITSAFLVWGTGTPAAINAGIRYLAIQVASGVLVLAGATAVIAQTGELTFGAVDPATLGGVLLLVGIGIKAGFPLLHMWIQDAYPKASPLGTVVLSAFTTKLAIYALIRGFEGFEPLILVGVVMALFPIVFAVVEDDLRRSLAYAMNSQLGFMVCGVGVGGVLGVGGAAAHAFVSVIYQALLFMGVGAIVHRLGTARASELGGLWRSMPTTAVFTTVGALAIAAFPLMSGFVAKSLILSALLKDHHVWAWVALVVAGAATMEHTTIRVPFFAFFAKDRGLRAAEAPRHMLVAMGLAAALCVYIGINPNWLYQLLPGDVTYEVYTLDHVITQMQLLVAAAFVFALFMRFGL